MLSARWVILLAWLNDQLLKIMKCLGCEFRNAQVANTRTLKDRLDGLKSIFSDKQNTALKNSYQHSKFQLYLNSPGDIVSTVGQASFLMSGDCGFKFHADKIQ